MMPRCALIVLLVLVARHPAAAQPAGDPPPARSKPTSAAAMYEFLVSRQAEAKDDAAGAEAALKRAIAIDPQSADLQAELASFYTRQNRAVDAVAAAEKALTLDASSEEAHRVLGLVNAAWADGVVDGPAGGSEETWRAAAIDHLQKIQGTPTMATDLGLQMTFARELVAVERAADAVPILERIVSQTGPAGEPASMLAEAHRSLGQFDQAIDVLERAAEANPRYFLALGDLYERQRKFPEAAEAFEHGLKAVRTPGRDLRLRYVSALLNIPDGKGADRAVAALTEFLNGTPKDAAALSLLARAHLQRGDPGAAQAAATQALAVDPRHLPTLALMAEYHRERYDFAAVAALLAPLEEDRRSNSPESAGSLVALLAELGGARQQIGDADGAVRAFERARAILPDAAPVAAALAQAYLQAGKPADAAKVAADARKGAASDLGLVRVEALAGIRAGRAADAIRTAETAVGTRKDTVAGAFTLADVYQEAKRHGDAIGVLAPLASARPDDDAVAFRLASAYDTADRVADAEKTFRGILARDPLNANALNYLGYMLANRGQKVPEALTLVDRALAAEPDNPAFLDSRGWALFKLGRAADAEAPLRRAATALRGSSVIQSHFAEVLMALGKRDEAADRLDLALKGDGVDVDRAALEKRRQQLGKKAR